MPAKSYRGRLAPSPTGYLHLGHARTFWTAQQRAHARGGALVLRNEDLDGSRCQPAFVAAMLEDLRWFGFQWQEGPDCGGPSGPYAQSERRQFYAAAFAKLRDGGFVYPCTCSRQDVLRALSAPHTGEEEPVYPGTCRPGISPKSEIQSPKSSGDALTSARLIPIAEGNQRDLEIPLTRPATTRSPHPMPGEGRGSAVRQPATLRSSTRINWRFRVPEGETIAFVDGHFGPQQFVAGKDFGDFVVWRHDDIPSYQLAVVVDDAAMGITEVVRGADLLASTARQRLLSLSLGLEPPDFFHCPLLTDAAGVRLAKRHDALSLRALRAAGTTPESLRKDWSDVGK